MQYFVYILYSKRDKKLYVGCTTNLEHRFRAHNSGKVAATKYRRPLVIIHEESFDDKTVAFNRERFLKILWGARFKKKVLREYLANPRGAKWLG